jgi:hypothetical protein
MSMQAGIGLLTKKAITAKLIKAKKDYRNKKTVTTNVCQSKSCYFFSGVLATSIFCEMLLQEYIVHFR